MRETRQILTEARQAVAALASASAEQKNRALSAMADALMTHRQRILDANRADMEAARGVLSPALLDRLQLTEKRIAAMAQGIRDVALLPDPVGETLSVTERPNGLVIEKVSVPLGLVAVIYESRPNVTSDAAALALKSGNVCVLRVGRDAFRSACAITEALRAGVKEAGLPEDAVNLVEDTSRESASALMQAVGLVDLLIPRGGAGLIRACVENARVPCIHTGTGICHVYVDKAADQDMALNIVENAKMSRPGVCNACEVCLVHRDIAPEFLPKLRARLCDPAREHVCTLKLDEEAAAIIPGEAAGEAGFDTEWLDYILSVKVVGDVQEAIRHIERHSTHHSESIITADPAAAELFTACVDSAAVYVNASTRFTDGGEFGLGCELGISTQKMHARGPMGLREMTAYKYIIRGSGQIR